MSKKKGPDRTSEPNQMIIGVVVGFKSGSAPLGLQMINISLKFMS